ncbi:MAG: hypothetical protein FJX34_00485, partial [Alphaproteobacteria bacterium]|nr:hypothetical protein [Alphaproteobacteria bacterium]
MVKDLINRLISHVHFLEPRENTKQRVISSLILISLALYAIFYSVNFFIILAIGVAMMMTTEWLDMIRREYDQTKWRTIGLTYILIPIFSVIKIRMIDANILFWMFAVIWATDIFAFFAGRSLGGPKLAPKISPNKTWSGLAGGMLASIIIGFLSSFMFPGGIIFFVFVSLFLSVIEQGSDLLESKFKRIFGVKDS